MKRGNIFQNLQQVYLTARNNFLQCLRKLFEKLTYQWNLRLATAPPQQQRNVTCRAQGLNQGDNKILI